MRLPALLTAAALALTPLTAMAVTIDFEGVVSDTGTLPIAGAFSARGFEIQAVGFGRIQIRGKDNGDAVPNVHPAIPTPGSAFLFALGSQAGISIERADGGLFDLLSVRVSEGYADTNFDSEGLVVSGIYADRTSTGEIIALDGAIAAGDPASYEMITLGPDFRNLVSVSIGGLSSPSGGPNGRSFGIDDIVLAEAPSAIPLPAAGWALLAGLAALAGMRRRA